MAEAGAIITKELLGLLKLAAEQGYMDRLRTLFKKKHRILVLGCTGVGKTELLKSLITLTPEVIDHLNRTEFAERHRIKIRNEPFVFVDTPGQYRSRRTRAIREEITRDITGILNVACYGYHENKVDRKNAFTPTGDIDEAFLEQKRKVEIDDAQSWAPLLGAPEFADWLITVVTKADLWWNRYDEVISHYSTGPYHQSLGDARSLNPVVLEYCSVFHKFYGQGSLSGAFDDSDRLRTRVHLLQSLLASIGKGGLNG
jgi:energy-coupling factor transporter ATP-binding protein EcfA2